MSDTDAGAGKDTAKPLRPRILVDSEAGRLNKGHPDGDSVARALPSWDLLPPDGLIARGS